MEIQMLTGKALALLKVNAEDNKEKYCQPQSFIHEYLPTLEGMGQYCFGSTIIVPDVDLLEGGSDKDSENAKRIFEAFRGHLNRTQATDRRMWAYMTHDTFWGYMTKRWPIKDDSSVGSILDRYFFERGALRNGIERLYWSAALTYDEAADSYEYTDFLLSKQDLLNQMDRAFTKNKNVLLASLKVLKQNGGLSEDRTRQYFTRIRQAGGITVLDALSPDRAEKLCQNAYLESAEESYVQNGSRLVLVKEKSNIRMAVTIKNGAAYLGDKSKLPISWNVLRRCRVGSKIIIRKNNYQIVEISQ